MYVSIPNYRTIKEMDSLWVYIIPPAILLLTLLGIYFIAIGLKRSRNDRLQRVEEKLDKLLSEKGNDDNEKL